MDFIGVIADRIREQLPAGVAPGHPRERELFRIYAVLALAKGQRTTGEDVHNAWAAWIGVVEPGHDALMPYSQLSGEQSRQDEPFVAAIHAACESGLCKDVEEP